MCQIRLLVIGNSAKLNNDVLWRMEKELISHEHVEVVSQMLKPSEDTVVDPSDHDLAIVDESVMTKDCSRSILGSGLPILVFGEVSKRGELFLSVIDDAIRTVRLREYIEKVRNDIEETRHMIAVSG